MSTYTISRDVCDNLLWSAQAVGLAVGDWPARVNREAHAARLPMAVFDAIWQDLIAQDPSPLLGLRLGSQFRLGRWGLVEHIILNAGTVGDAMRGAVDYWKLVVDADKTIDLEQDLERWRIAFSSALPHPRAAFEVDMSYVLQFFRMLLGRVPDCLRVGFVAGSPGLEHEAAFERHFGCPVAFGQPVNWIAIGAAVAAQPLPAALPALRESIAAQADVQLAQLGRDVPLAHRVAQLVELGATDVAQVARHLHLSARSLQRKLEAEGQSFSAIRDEARRKRLARLLAEPNLALKEVAYLLGYEERSLFDACTRWYGQSPAVLREQLLAAGRA